MATPSIRSIERGRPEGFARLMRASKPDLYQFRRYLDRAAGRKTGNIKGTGPRQINLLESVRGLAPRMGESYGRHTVAGQYGQPEPIRASMDSQSFDAQRLQPSVEPQGVAGSVRDQVGDQSLEDVAADAVSWLERYRWYRDARNAYQ